MGGGVVGEESELQAGPSRELGTVVVVVRWAGAGMITGVYNTLTLR